MAKKKKNKVSKRTVSKKVEAPKKETAVKAEAAKPAKKFNLFRFLKEVRSETSKVTWPGRKETTSATLMVFVMVVAVAFFFFFVDKILAAGVRTVLGLGA